MDSIQYRLSVIVPIYNGANYITNLVHNILEINQAFLNQIEIVFVDDGSKDGSYRLLQELTCHYSNISLYSKINGGIASARQFGIEKCQGKYIAFCDQDDKLLQSYGYFLDLLDSTKADMLISNYSVCTNGGQIRKSCYAFSQSDILLSGEKLRKSLINHIDSNLIDSEDKEIVSFPPTLWNCIFSKDLIDNKHLHFFAFVDYEDDWLFILQNMYQSSNVILTNNIYYCWKINSLSESHTQKYLKNLFERKFHLEQWISRLLLNLGVERSKVDSYLKNDQARTIIEVFYNSSCCQNYKTYIKEIRKIELLNDANGLKRFGRLFNNQPRKLFMFLLIKKYYFFAYIINRFFFKRGFH